MKDQRKQTYLLLALATVFWGIQPLCIKLIIQEWTPAALTCLRYLLISATLFLIMFIRKEPRLLPPQECILPLVAMGATGIAVNNVAQFTGLQYSTVTNCTLIAATAPAITALLSAACIRERLNVVQWLGILISFLGVGYLVSKGSLAALYNLSLNFGDMLFFTCQIVWAAYSLLGLRVMRHMSAIAATAWSGLFGSGIVAAYALVMGELHYAPLTVPAAQSFAFVVFLGGVASMVFWNIGVKNAGPSLSAIFSNLTPVIGMACGAAFLSETVGFQQICGAIVIFSGVYLTTHSVQAASWLGRRK